MRPTRETFSEITQFQTHSGKTRMRYALPVAIVLSTALAYITTTRAAELEIAGNPPDFIEVDNEACLKCHSDKKLKAKTERGKTLNLLVEKKEFSGTFHENIACVDCHQGAETFTEAPHNSGKGLRLACAFCHDKVFETYLESVHGALRATGDFEVPSCSDCHGRHNIYPITDLRSSVNKFKLSKTCGECHQSAGAPASREVSQIEPATNFVDSIHGRALEISGLTVAPTCNDCHSAHDIQKRDNPDSTISKKNIPKTCGKCHMLVEKTYNESIHGKLLVAGDDRGPTCIQCHSSHQISPPGRSEFRTDIDKKCGNCHEERLEQYRETLHGKAIVLGREDVAACSDCHGNHDMLPATDPRSHINEKNRLQTCRKCHPKATKNFADYVVHAHHTDRESCPQVYWVFIFMTALLVGTFAFFAMHTVLWAIRSTVAFLGNRKKFTELKIMAKKDKEEYVRFQPIDRFLHLLIIFSFMLLVITGMPLKFFYTDWAQWMLAAMQGHNVAAVLHRVGAIITIFYFTTHIAVLNYSIWRGRARFKDADTGKYTLKKIMSEVLGPDSPVPTFQDFRDFWAHQKWFLGKGEQPQFDRWTYWEKFDYMAVFWGVGVIGMSGLILWFPEAFTTFLPGWAINVALVVHSDEALLAAGFIFTFHFFNVHFRLEKFPIDTVIFSGRISRTELHHERRRQLERWEKAGKLEENRVKDEWASWRKIAIPAGIAAFVLGVTIVILIYSAIITRFLHG